MQKATPNDKPVKPTTPLPTPIPELLGSLGAGGIPKKAPKIPANGSFIADIDPNDGFEARGVVAYGEEVDADDL